MATKLFLGRKLVWRCSLRVYFSRYPRVGKDKKEIHSKYIAYNEGEIMWQPLLRSPLNDWEITPLASLLSIGEPQYSARMVG